MFILLEIKIFKRFFEKLQSKEQFKVEKYFFFKNETEI